ncbi:hypothetical protein DL768_002291 [Monosporascus sp. mg162]|nr:hypothetical protein DL768_002291 [Monosporascus sp. mg162]
MVPFLSTDPDETLGRPRAFLLKKGTLREYDTLEFHVSSKAGFLWEYINPNTEEFPPLLKRPIFPDFKKFDSNASSELDLGPEADAKFQRAVKIHDREQTLFLAQEKALAEISTFLNQSVYLDRYWVYWKKATFRDRLKALKNKFKPSNNARIYEVDGRYREALKTNRVQMDAWLSNYWRVYTEAEELSIPAVAGYHAYFDFLKACVCGVVHTFKEYPYICPKVRPSGWTEDLEVRKKVDERIANGTSGLKVAVKRARKETKEQTPQQQIPLKRSTLMDTCSDFHVGNRKADFIDLHLPTVGGRLLAGGKYLDILGKGTRKITLTTSYGRTRDFFLKNCLYVPEMHTNLASYRLFRKVGIYWNFETDVVYHKASKTSRTQMAKIRWIERQPVIHHVEVTAENDADDVVTSAAFAVTEKPEEYREPEAAVPEDESDLKEEVILESEDEDVVTEPLIEKFLPAKLTNQKKFHGNDFRGPLKPLEGDATLWHRRLAHLGPRALEKVVQAVTGAKIQLPSKIDCQDCAVAKARKKVSRRPQTRERKPFVTICADLFEFNSAFNGRTKALIITCPVIGARISYTMKRKKHALTALMNAVTERLPSERSFDDGF